MGKQEKGGGGNFHSALRDITAFLCDFVMGVGAIKYFICLYFGEDILNKWATSLNAEEHLRDTYNKDCRLLLVAEI